MKRLFISGLLLQLVLTSLTFAQNEPKIGGTLIWGRATDSTSLEPALNSDGEAAKVMVNLYEGLVRYKGESTEIEPALAVSWDASEDGKEWIFHLRKGVLFHDGTPFNAEAVLFSFLRQIDPNHPFYRKDWIYASFTFQYVKKVEALNEYGIKITLKKPYAPFLYCLAMPYATPIVSPSAAGKWGDGFERHPVGTGPFVFEEWIPGDRIILRRNENYWGPPAHLDKLIFKTINNNKNRVLALKTGAIHGMDGVDPEAVEEIKKDKRLQLKIASSLNVGYLAMNTEKKPFDDVRVRQAVNHAINKSVLIKLFYQELAVPAQNPIPPTLWGYNDDIVDYEYNPERAKQLLKEAGYGQGFETTLWTMPVARPYMPQPMKMAQAIRNNLSVIGIRARIVSHDWKTYLSKVFNGEHDMCLLGWVGDIADPDNFLYSLLDKDNAVKPKAENHAFLRNDRLHELLIQAQQTTDIRKRIELYRMAQVIIHEEAPWVPLAHAERIIALREKVHGVVQLENESMRFDKAWIE